MTCWVDEKSIVRCRITIKVKIINDLANLESNIHLFKYDSVHGTYKNKIKKNNNSFDIGLGKIEIISETNPLKLPWKKNNIDIEEMPVDEDYIHKV